MGRRMKRLCVLGGLCVIVSLAFGCAKGRDVKSAEKEDKLAFGEDGKGQKCGTPKSSCDEIKEPSLDFKEKCREAGFRMKQCGCDNLCSGNINGDRVGFTSKNDQKTCKPSSDKCETPETSAAYQDGCDMVGGEMMECGCEWLCSKKLKEPIPDAPKEDAEKDGAAGDGEKKKEEKPKAEAPGNMDGKSADEIAKEKAAKDKAAKDKAEQEKQDKKSSKDKKESGKKESGKEKSRFFDE